MFYKNELSEVNYTVSSRNSIESPETGISMEFFLPSLLSAAKILRIRRYGI